MASAQAANQLSFACNLVTHVLDPVAQAVVPTRAQEVTAFSGIDFDLDRPGPPYVRAVFPDRAVRRELAHPCNIQDRHAVPAITVPLRRADLVLALDVRPVR